MYGVYLMQVVIYQGKLAVTYFVDYRFKNVKYFDVNHIHLILLLGFQ